MALFAACALTVVLETAFLAMFGYRDRYGITVIVCVNTITNLLLNMVLTLVPGGAGWWILVLEPLVVLAEYLIYAVAFGGSGRLFVLTFAANVLSFAAGLLLF